MDPIVTAVLSLAGITISGLVAWLLGARKSGAEADSVAVAAAERAVAIVRNEMDRMRTQIDELRALAERCDEVVAALRVENTGLRARISVLESEAHHNRGDGR